VLSLLAGKVNLRAKRRNASGTRRSPLELVDGQGLDGPLSARGAFLVELRSGVVRLQSDDSVPSHGQSPGCALPPPAIASVARNLLLLLGQQLFRIVLGA
jgi:hypothetical protein